MKIFQLSGIAGLLLLAGCFAPKAGQPELEGLTRDVLKTKEGIDIRITPVDKPKVVQVK